MAVDVERADGQGSTLGAAIKASSRSDLVVICVVFVFYIVATAALAFSWPGRKVGIQMEIGGFGMTILYLTCLWHSVKVRGGRQTIAFFGLAAGICLFAEIMGDNYNWFFGAYEYTETLGPRIAGVPVLIVALWGVPLYCAFMMVGWFLGLGGRRWSATWYGHVIWSALVAFSSAMIVCAWDLIADPFCVSGLWMQVNGVKPFWWWDGGNYLPQLLVWKGAGGIPISNFIGWTFVPFTILFLFCLLFRRPDKVSGKLVNIVPWLIYGYMYYTFIWGLLEMSWLDPGMVQPALIGTFTMGPVIVLGLVKVVRDYSRVLAPPG